MTLRILNYGNDSLFLLMGHAKGLYHQPDKWAFPGSRALGCRAVRASGLGCFVLGPSGLWG